MKNWKLSWMCWCLAWKMNHLHVGDLFLVEVSLCGEEPIPGNCQVQSGIQVLRHVGHRGRMEEVVAFLEGSGG